MKNQCEKQITSKKYKILQFYQNNKRRGPVNPEKDFKRHRKLGFSAVIRLILSIGSAPLGQELLKYFQFDSNFPSVSAFIQQRQKIKPEAFSTLFKRFSSIPQDVKLFKGYRLLAAIVTMTERLPEWFPVIITADRGYENYNFFAHVEEKLFDYVVRLKSTKNNGSILSGLNLPAGEVFDITKDIVITRHSTDPYAVNKEKYKYMTKQERFDFIPSSKYPNYEMSIRFLFFLRAVCSMPP